MAFLVTLQVFVSAYKAPLAKALCSKGKSQCATPKKGCFCHCLSA